jgi:hypothetical protein
MVQREMYLIILHMIIRPKLDNLTIAHSFGAISPGIGNSVQLLLVRISPVTRLKNLYPPLKLLGPKLIPPVVLESIVFVIIQVTQP